MGRYAEDRLALMRTTISIRITDGRSSEEYALGLGDERGEVSIDCLVFELRRVLAAMQEYSADVSITMVAHSPDAALLCARLGQRPAARETHSGVGILSRREIE